MEVLVLLQGPFEATGVPSLGEPPASHMGVIQLTCYLFSLLQLLHRFQNVLLYPDHLLRCSGLIPDFL